MFFNLINYNQQKQTQTQSNFDLIASTINYFPFIFANSQTSYTYFTILCNQIFKYNISSKSTMHFIEQPNQHQPPAAPSNEEPPYITYNNQRLFHYSKTETFKDLNQQYNKITGKNASFVINGLSIGLDVKIDDIVKSQRQARLFDQLLKIKQGNIVVAKANQQDYCSIIYRIMKNKELNKDYSEQIQVSKVNVNFQDESQIQGSKVMPHRMIMWIDDEPQNNFSIIQNYISHLNIQIFQIKSTQQMINIVQKQYEMLSCLTNTVIFISDMTRKEGGNWNSQAGVQLYDYLYNVKKLTNKGIFFVQNIQGAYDKIKSKHLENYNIQVVSKIGDLVFQINKSFKLNKPNFLN